MDFIILILLFLISASFAAFLFKAAKFKTDIFEEDTVFYLLIGLGITAYFIFFLGLLGLVYKQYIILLLLSLALISVKQITDLLNKILQAIRKFTIKKASFYEKTILFFILTALLLTFIAALSPPTSNDSLAYRLVHVRIFSESHKVFHIPYTRESLWPYLMEMLFLFGFVIKSDILAKLISWSFDLIGIFLIYVFSKKFFTAKTALYAALIFLLTPAISNQFTTNYVDVALAIYTVAALFAMINYFNTNYVKWAVISGILCGLVLSVKYNAVLIFPALAAVFLYYFILAKEKKPVLKGVFIFVIFMILFSCAWYIRAYAVKGNPVYPLFARFFHGYGWERAIDKNIGSAFSIINFLRMPWDITMHVEKFGSENIGIIYLLFAPLAALAYKSKKIFSALATFIFVYTATWFLIVPYTARPVFAALLPLSILIGCGICRIFDSKDFYSKVVKIVFILCCAFNIAYLAVSNADKLKVGLGMETKQYYLLRTERTYAVSSYVNDNLPVDSKILMIGEVRSYYIHRPFVHFRNLVDEEKIPDTTLNAEQFLKELSHKYGIHYVLYLKDKLSYPWLETIARKAKCVYKYDFVDKKGNKFSYFLYNISEISS
ncbi:MAG: glycosyltransferase family 39 protein [Candidatus Omnitrophica bacterium]|nr:glycosyltransferase family 39 protein [Candidatus Omnitrophota bacterium]